jgi:hypothetical protein
MPDFQTREGFGVQTNLDLFGPEAVEAQIVEVGRDLARSFSGVLAALPGGPHRPQWLARTLGVNTVLTSRLIKAAQQDDPLAVTHMMPGPEPLRRLLRAAERKKVDRALIEQARTAVNRFARLIDVEAGDRSGLDAIISGWLPDARQRVELIAKQSVFRGMSQLLGMSSEVEHHCHILYPSRDATERADLLWIAATRGLRRVRPGLLVTYDTVHFAAPMLTIGGRPVEGLDGLLLAQFCSHPLPQLQVCRTNNVMRYMLSGDGVGVQSAVNLVHGTLLPQAKEMRRAAGEPPRKTSVAVGVGTPTKALLFDVLMHPDVYPEQVPALKLFRTAGIFERSHVRHDANRLDVIETVQPLGKGVAKFRVAETPAYQDMIRHACAERGWDAAALHGFRCRIEFPMYSSEVVMEFELAAN